MKTGPPFCVTGKETAVFAKVRLRETDMLPCARDTCFLAPSWDQGRQLQLTKASDVKSSRFSVTAYRTTIATKP